MSISSIGAGVAASSSLEAYLLRQERIALFQQESSELVVLRNPVASASTNTSAARNASANRSASSVSSSAQTNAAISTNTNGHVASTAPARYNTRTGVIENSSGPLTLASTFNPSNGINGYQISVLAARSDIDAQIASARLSATQISANQHISFN